MRSDLAKIKKVDIINYKIGSECKRVGRRGEGAWQVTEKKEHQLRPQRSRKLSRVALIEQSIQVEAAERS